MHAVAKIAKNLEKSQFLLKLLNSSGKGGTRVSSKNCDFYNFSDFSRNCEKLERVDFNAKAPLNGAAHSWNIFGDYN